MSRTASTTSRNLQPEDLRWLACPVCFSSLALETNSVRCTGCTRSYPVIDGIPVLLASRAGADAPHRF
ncbi:MAG TPA: hypothetical protein VJU82_12860 [Acidobacteriaceae bacterium]|nr:hypothetical protein [Acidobacteriaceae bacterium]